MANLSDLFPATPAGNTFPIYDPAMMQFDGSTGYYINSSFTTSGNKLTLVFRIRCDSFTGSKVQPFRLVNSVNSTGLAVNIYASDESTYTDQQNNIEFRVFNTSGVRIANMQPETIVCDGETHTLFFSFDGDAGTAELYMDGVSTSDTSFGAYTAPTTGTLRDGSGMKLSVGASYSGSEFFAGDLGFIGYDDSGGLSWSDFMDSNGDPINQDEATWSNSGWGSQPLFWNEHGAMDDNRGSAGDMTENGTITIADTEEVTATDYGLGPAYQPAMMDLSGPGEYQSTMTTAGDLVTVCGTFKRGTFTGLWEFLIYVNGFRPAVTLTTSDDSDVPSRGRLSFRVTNSVGTNICWLWSDDSLIDGAFHSFFAAFSGTAGTGILYIDGVLQTNTSPSNYVAPTTGTLATGATEPVRVGNHATIARPYLGQIGFVGYREAYLTNWSDFFTASGLPKQLDETTWTEWGAQPKLWNEHGEMSNNQGSNGNMTESGTIVVAPAS